MSTFTVNDHSRHEGTCLVCGHVEQADSVGEVGLLMVAHHNEKHAEPVEDEDR